MKDSMIDEILYEGMKNSQKGFENNTDLKRDIRKVKKKQGVGIWCIPLILYSIVYFSLSISLMVINFQNAYMEAIKLFIIITSTISFVVMGYLTVIGILKFDIRERGRI